VVGDIQDISVPLHPDGGDIRSGASRYADEHEQSGIGIEELGQVQRGGADTSTGAGLKGASAGQGASRYANEHEQPACNVLETRPMGRGWRAGAAGNKTRKNTLGPEHPDILASMHNLAFT